MPQLIASLRFLRVLTRPEDAPYKLYYGSHLQLGPSLFACLILYTVLADRKSAAMTTSSISDEAPTSPPAPYTAFSRPQKRLLTFILTTTMLASPLTATVYFPLLPILASRFHASLQRINLTITVYVIAQAISPLLFSTSSDTIGRRPILLITYTLYALASLGLALNKHSYAALLILRALQSLGASAVLAVAYGVIADVYPPAERGTIQGFVIGASNLATCLGPVIGGWVVLGSGGFEWVFWALLLFGSGVLLLVAMALPETARSVVGNGSVEMKGWRQSWWSLIKIKTRGMKSGVSEEKGEDEEKIVSKERQATENNAASTGGRTGKYKIANPWTSLRILFWKDTALVLWMSSSPYAIWYCVQTSIPLIYREFYGFDELQIGLAYLSGALGVISGSYLNGRLMDWNYRVTARRIGHTIDKVSGDDLAHFPIEEARARGSYFLLIIYSCALAGYGWVVTFHVHESAPLILQFVLGMLCTSFQQTFSALLVDIFPMTPSAAAAAGNAVKCVLSAGAVAVLQPLTGAVGRGWVFTILTALSGGGGFVAIWVMTRKGMDWRRGRIGMIGVV